MPAPRRRQPLTEFRGEIALRGAPEYAAALGDALAAPNEIARDELTHGFHTYPARLHPGIARVLLERVKVDDPLVLDPFAGSGTVLVEAFAAGRPSVGVDLNPLAVRIAETKCERRDEAARERFLAAAKQVAEASEARVRARTPVVAHIPKWEVRYYEGHVLKELAGLLEEIRKIEEPRDVRALEMVFSSIIVKFSKQRADTSDELVDKRLRKGLVTEFFARKAQELVQRWAALDATAPKSAPAPRVVHGDARKLASLLGSKFACDLVITSPPYGGTYDYEQHHARRYPWLGIDARAFERGEIGARRRSKSADAPKQWEKELVDTLRAMSAVLRPGGYAVLVVGDARFGQETIDAPDQLRALAGSASFEALAAASQARPDWLGGPPRREHLVALRRTARSATSAWSR